MTFDADRAVTRIDAREARAVRLAGACGAAALLLAVLGPVPAARAASAGTPPPQAASAPRSAEERLAVLEARPAEQGSSGLLTTIVGLSAAVVALLSLVNGRRQTLRDGMFKCFEGYLKVMDYKARALEAADGATPKADEYQRYLAYYRALFDLQWTEYYLWKNRTLRDEPYEQWLVQRYNQFNERAVDRQDGSAKQPISYALVWEKLRKDGYYDAADPFVAHLEKVHSGVSPKRVLGERKPLQGWV